MRHLGNTGQVYGKLMDINPLELSNEELAKQSYEQIGLNERANSRAKGVESVFTSYTLDQNEAQSFGKGNYIGIVIDQNICHLYETETDIKKNRNLHTDKYPLVKGQDTEILVPNHTPIQGIGIFVSGKPLDSQEKVDGYLKHLDEKYAKRKNAQQDTALKAPTLIKKHSSKIEKQRDNKDYKNQGIDI